MYQHPLVYGDSPFERPATSPMYPMRPYYAEDGDNIASPVTAVGGSTISRKPLDKSPLLSEEVARSLSEPSSEALIDELLSRQMLLLCRLNEFEAKLSSKSIELSQTSKQNVSSTLNFSSPSAVLCSNVPGTDNVIHFSFDNPPFAVFAFVRFLMKSSPTCKILANFHAHSSISEHSDITKQICSLKTLLKSTLGFEFTSSGDYLSREECSIKFSFIATNNSQKILQKSQELNVVKELANKFSLETSGLVDFWKLFTDSVARSNDSKVIEYFRPYASKLGSNSFLTGSTPVLEDFLLYSLSIEKLYPRGSFVAPCITGTQLLNHAWRSAIQSFFEK